MRQRLLRALRLFGIEFIVDAHGRVTELRFKQPGGVFTAKKVGQ